MAQIRTFRDLDLNFTKHPSTKDVAARVGDQSVIRSVRNLIYLSFYEKPFHPEIGSSVRQMLFENLTPLTAQNLKTAIEDVITNFEPRVRIKEISIFAYYDSNQIEVKLEFFIENNINPTITTIFLERVR